MKRNFFLIIFLSLFFGFQLYAMDPILSLTLSRAENPFISGAPPYPQPIHILAENIDAEYFKKIAKSAGIFIKSCGDDYCNVLATPEQINTLLKEGYEDNLHIPLKMKPLLNLVVPAVGAYDWHTGTTTEKDITGKGVLIGVIDTGVDIYHPDFRNPDGSTRIAYLWDQTIDEGESHYPENFDYGYECDAIDINEMKCPSNDKGTLDEPSEGHGTHVAGILASNNSKYTGMAPDATLIVVKSLFDEASVVDAARYVIQKAVKLQMPVVINMSFGSDAGPHDGTTWVENELGKDVGNGRIIVAAAGNQGDITPHYGGKATQETGWLEIIPQINLPAEITGSQQQDVYLDIWGKGEMSFKILVVDDQYKLVSETTKDFSYQNCSCTSSSCNNLVCSEDIKDSSGKTIASVGMAAGSVYGNYKTESVIVIHPVDSSFTSYRWFLGFKSGEGYNFNFNAWVVNSSGWFTSGPDESYYVEVTSGTQQRALHVFFGDNKCTVTVPATSSKVIGVGSYVIRNSWIKTIDGQIYMIGDTTTTVGDISKFSSRGGCVSNIYKPDFTAPGEWIVSSMSQNVNMDPYQVIDKYHDLMRGTSMASPVVAGGIALILQVEETIPYLDLYNLLTQNAKEDYFTGSTPNDTWGYGKFSLDGVYSLLKPEHIQRDPLQIFNIKVTRDNIEGTIKISWYTNRLVDSTVEYWEENNSKKSSVSIMSYSTRHEITLKVSSYNKFYYRIKGTSPYDETVETKTYSIEIGEPSTGCGCRTSGNSSFDPGIFLLILVFIYVRKKFAAEKR